LENHKLVRSSWLVSLQLSLVTIRLTYGALFPVKPDRCKRLGCLESARQSNLIELLLFFSQNFA
jgi:hypothetical protein